ncbi:pentapeptide repeat-containing protein [Moorena producens JHB]|uniref:Pentapeptide repeat-containing protein n=1 Tax=Moorena producens (strain JHB) TaxID=1454205 RepID=A0A1D9G5P9_MOOP1|nr:pentapeptide repeat-containing protein [Moorena producens]AOY82881.2 pentapeptide repeat-containing protein [Moorena producens JHB]
MGKLVVINLGEGNLETAFSATLKIGDERALPSIELLGKLPPAPEFSKLHKRWYSIYQNLGFSVRALNKKTQLNTSIISIDQFRQLSNDLEKSLNSWLNSEDFRVIKEGFLQNLNRSEEIRVIIQVEDIQLRRIPWHLWDIFDYYRYAEVALGELTYDKVKRPVSSMIKDRVRILAVLGNSDGINLEKDRELLEHLPNTEITFLVEPSRLELDRELWDEKAWDILFFSGHSYSQGDGKSGYIYINRTDSLLISELKNALKASIERGLKIAIFNSCDGLGLAQSLTDLHIPQVIVMREPVPDLVAQEFLKGFLKSFSRGESLYISVREAREQLQGLENDFPCATWLPVLFQNPAELPPIWNDLAPMSFITQQQPNKEDLILYKKRVEAWNQWRARNTELVPDLIKINLTGANLRGANLSNVNLSGSNLTGANLTQANLSNVNLTGANLSEANLTQANLTQANLTGANLTAVQGLNTNFEQALLTGACIQDWNINSATNLDGIICAYVYLRDSQQERRPYSGNFTTGEFSKLFQKALETLDLIFLYGVNWQEFVTSFQNIKVESGAEELGIQAIENQGNGTFVIHINTPKEFKKAEIENDFKQHYELALKAVEEKYRAELKAKDNAITIYREQNANLMEIIKLQANRPIHNAIDFAAKVENQPISEEHTFNEHRFNIDQRNSSIGFAYAGTANDSQIVGTQHYYAPTQKQNLAEAAAEIQQLLNQLSQTKATTTEIEKLTVVAEVAEQINSNPTLKARVINALKAEGTEALKEAIDHPLVNILIATIEGWKDV